MPLLAAVLARLLLLAAALPRGAFAAAGDETRYNASACPKSVSCGDSVEIRYPFFLANTSITIIEGTAYSNSYCGYPGMAIACDGGRATLKLKDDNYTVLSIDYPNHTVTVADSGVLDGGGDCPRVNHSVAVPTETWLNLSTTANDNLAFYFDCVFTAPTPAPPIPPINCSSFPERDRVSYVAAEPDVPRDDQLRRACKEVLVVPVLKDRLLSYLPVLNGDGYGEVLKQGFQLTWDPSQGPCYVCEKSGGQCSYNQSGRLLGCLCSDGRVRDEKCGSKNTRKRALTIGTSIAAGVLSVLLVVMTFLYIRKRRQYKMTSSSRLLKYTASGGTPRSRDSTDMESSVSVHSLQTHHFTYEELEEATDSFSGAMEIGDGGFGTVYKGHLRDGRVVAVKRLYNNSCRRVEQFLNEAAILSRLRHPNLVLFYGCTSSRSRELLLVYELVPNGTVADHLPSAR